MKRILWFLLATVFLMTLSGCSESQAQAMVPEIEFVTLEGQQCPQLKIADMDEDKIINTINAEIEAHFLSFIPQKVDGSAWDNIVIRTFVSSTDTVISVLLKSEMDVVYGTDGAVWGICYDFKNNMIVPCAAYLFELGYSYSEVCKRITALLNEKSTYEYVSIPYLYFDSNSNPILVAIALEHPDGAEPWTRIHYYSLDSDTFVSLSGTLAAPAPQAEIVQSNMSDNVDIQVNEISPNYFSSQSMFFLGSFEEMTRDEILSQFGIPLDLSTVMPNMQEAEDTCYGFYHLGNGGLFYQFTFKYVDIETEQIISITLRNNGLPITMINEAYENELQKSILCGQEVRIAHYTDLAGASTYYGEFSDGDLSMMIIAMDCSIEDFIRALEYLIQL